MTSRIVRPEPHAPAGARARVPCPDRPAPAGTSRADLPAPVCSPLSGCVTCSDEARPMRVVRVAEDAIALCEDEAGALHDILIGVVDGVCAGDTVLVHAGAALLKLSDEGETGT